MVGVGVGVGMGATACRVAPSWCEWAPFADYFDACQPMTPEEVRACGGEMGGSASPATLQAAMAGGDVVAAAYCRMHPEECRNYLAALDCPTASAMVGPSVAAMFGCQAEDHLLRPGADWRVYLALGVGALGLLLLIKK